MKSYGLLFVLGMSLGGAFARGNSAAVCPEKLDAFENIQIQQSLSSDNQTCFLSIHPRDAFETMIYRDYLLTSEGLMMVFNSYDASDDSQASGAREFYFLNQNFSHFNWQVEMGKLMVTGLGGLTFAFDLSSAQLTDLTGAKIRLASEVTPKNQGGLEIDEFAGLWIDTSFRLGSSPSTSLKSVSKVQNASGEVCRTPNSSLFTYAEGEARVRSVSELQKSTRLVCPNFSWSRSKYK